VYEALSYLCCRDALLRLDREGTYGLKLLVYEALSY
jgi:hypothetical protein